MEEFCRLCLKQNPPYFSLLETPTAHMFESLTAIKIKCDDQAPNLTCLVCLNEVKTAYIIQQRLIEAEKYLQEKISFTVVKQESKGNTEASGTSENILKCENEETRLLQEHNYGVSNMENKHQTQFKCKLCLHVFNGIKSYKQHKKIHKQKVQCGMCPKIVLKTELKKHRLTHVTGYCEYCGKTMKNSSNLAQHVSRWHKPRKIICEYCGDILDKEKDFQLHVNKFHTNNPQFLCDICGTYYFKLADLNRHIKMKHAERKFSCATCNQAFPYMSDLKSHEAKHSGDVCFVCETCGNKFKSRPSMVIHQKTFHGCVTGKFQCGFCQQKFSKKFDLRVHRVTVHNK